MRAWLADAAVLVLLLVAPAIAADGTKPGNPKASAPETAQPQLKSRDLQPVETQRQAQTLLERARKFSDIRATNASPFRLKATFSFIDDQLETLAGTYTEFWQSGTQWRKEIVVAGRKKIEIASNDKLWEFESDPSLPEQALRVEFATDIFPSPTAKLDFAGIETIPNVKGLQCAITKAGAGWGKSELCFDEATGAVVEHIVPYWGRYHITDFSCAYGDFKKFKSRWFPYEMACRQAGHRQMEVHVVELSAVNFAVNSEDAKLFEPPAGSTELGYCMAAEVAPKPDYTPVPIQPAALRKHKRKSSVMVRMVVNSKGEPQDIRVVRPCDKSLGELAVGTVGKWRFKPATCNGEPMAQRIDFEVAFQPY